MLRIYSIVFTLLFGLELLGKSCPGKLSDFKLVKVSIYQISM